MEIITPRLRLALPSLDDAEVFFAAVLTNYDLMSRWLPWVNDKLDITYFNTYISRVLKDYSEKKCVPLLIWDRKTSELYGQTGLHNIDWKIPSFETGYWGSKSAAGKGIITEAVHAVAIYAFQGLSAKRLSILCDEQNLASQSIPNKLGFDLEGILRNDSLNVKGQLRNSMVFSRIDLDALPKLDVSW